LNGLSHLPELRVTARTSSFAFKGQAVDIPTIAEELGVAHVLEGSVRASGDKLRITAQLIDSSDGTHEWSETYDRDLRDVFAIQDDITKNVVSALATTLGIRVEQPVPSGSTRNMQAYTHFLRGNQIIRNFSGVLFGGGGTLDSESPSPSAEQVMAWYLEAIAHFQSAIELDPQFGDAYAALAGAYFWGAGYEPDPDARKEMRMTSKSIKKKAVSVSPGSSEGLRLAAGLSDDYEEKKALLRKAIELDPNNVEAMTSLAWLIMDHGREHADYDLEEALKLARRAMKLDPLNFRSAFTLAEPLWRTGRLKEAAEAWVLFAAMRRGSLSTKPEVAEDLPAAPVNIDFQRGVVGWNLDERCRQGTELSTIHLPELDGQVVVSKNGCEFLQKFLAGPYHDKYIRLAVNFKVKGADSHAFLRMAMTDSDGYVVNKQEGTHEPVRGDSEWTERQLPLYVPEQAEVIGIKVATWGSGEVWMDDLRVEVADNPDFENAVRIGEYD
jgi:tetratricopeptide (TPR) repeat protein